MRNVWLILFILVCVFDSCDGPRTWDVNNIANGDDSQFDDVSEINAPRRFNYENTVLSYGFIDQVYHSFSEKEADDKFSFFVPKGNINETKCILTIENKVGDTLFADTVLTAFLIDKDDLFAIYSDEEMGNYIVNKAKNVLDSSSFCKSDDAEVNGIFSESLDTSDFDNFEIFSEVRDDKRYLFALSFEKEGSAYLGYSKSAKQAKFVYY
jgi:hypothetical protein